MAEYKYEFVKVRVHDGIAWASLNRPDKRNAMSPRCTTTWTTRWRGSKSTTTSRSWWSAARAAISAPARTCKKFFRELEKNPGERKKAAAAANRWRWERLYNYDKPTIAMVHGFCVGGAFMQLLGLRFRHRRRERDVLAVGGELGHPAGRAGVQGGGRHGAAAPRALLRLPGRAVRRQGGRAHRHDQLRGAAEKLEDAVTELAERLMKKSPAVLRATKHAIRHVRTMDVRAGLRLPRRQGHRRSRSPTRRTPTTPACGSSSTRSPTSRPSSRSSSARMLTDQRAKSAREDSNARAERPTSAREDDR